MRLKKIVIGLLEEDIVNFLKLQNKVHVDSIKIDNKVFATGQFELLKLKIKFGLEFIFHKVEHNNVYVNIENFKVYNMNIPKPILNKAFNFLIKSFTEIEGISFEEKYFKLEVTKLIHKYYEEQEIIDIDKLQIIDVSIEENEIELVFGGINISSNIYSEDNVAQGVEYVEAEIVNEPQEKITFTPEEIEKYEKDFNEQSFFNKIKQYGKTAGVSVVYAALILYYTYRDKNVPLKAKAISLGALGYFILPTDFIPDIFLAVGFTDDLIALTTAIKSITAYVNDDIRLKAKNRLMEWFESVDEKELEKVDSIIL